MAWFKEMFGFVEGDSDYDSVRKRFDYSPETGVLKSLANGSSYHAGLFSTPSVGDLRKRLAQSQKHDLGSATYKTIQASVDTLHEDPRNADAVFQAASQFNCLEMIGPSVKPEAGVTWYIRDHTQGPTCAMACPAGTVVRNYLCQEGRGQGHGHQVDTLGDVGLLLENEKHSYWTMRNGYCMPRGPTRMKELGARLEADEALYKEALQRVCIGIQADTEVQLRREKDKHRVCQVYASALPVAYAKTTPSQDWAPFASLVLNAAYEGTLTYAAALARERGSRVTVFLTQLGGGVFGNRTLWIHSAIEKAVTLCKDEAIDIVQVSYGHIPTSVSRLDERIQGILRHQ